MQSIIHHLLNGDCTLAQLERMDQQEHLKKEDLWTQNPSPNDWYAGWSKRMGEVQINAYDEQYEEPRMSIIKPANIYGKFDNFDLRTSTLIPSLTRKVAEATESVEIWGTGTAGRDIIHARDVARAAIFAVENRISEPMNVGNGKTFTIKSVIEALVKVSGKIWKSHTILQNQPVINSGYQLLIDLRVTGLKFLLVWKKGFVRHTSGMSKMGQQKEDSILSCRRKQ